MEKLSKETNDLHSAKINNWIRVQKAPEPICGMHAKVTQRTKASSLNESADLSNMTTWELTLMDAKLNSELLHTSTSLSELRETDIKHHVS